VADIILAGHQGDCWRMIRSGWLHDKYRLDVEGEYGYEDILDFLTRVSYCLAYATQ